MLGQNPGSDVDLESKWDKLWIVFSIHLIWSPGAVLKLRHQGEARTKVEPGGQGLPRGDGGVLKN